MALQHRILVVDDEPGMRELLEIILTGDGYEVTAVPDVKQARQQLLGRDAYDLVLTDLRIGSDHTAGMKFLSWAREHACTMPIIMITAYGSVETAVEAMKRGAADYLMKPFKNDEIRLRVKRALEQRDLLRQNVALLQDQAARGSLDNILGLSAAIEEVRNLVRRVAVLPSTVAIHGESGTGKELVARGIHQLSRRADKPFVAVNCGAFPENLLESELFGHRKGSFTDAVEDKEGLFVVADGGTLFLDEIGDMPFALQVKLLRVLDNNTVFPLGGTTGIKVDVRIISATNHDLQQMVREGRFREDLYYRLNVIPIFVPPLRDRADDIPLLARRFAARHAAKMGLASLEIAPEAEQMLQRFRWPGNVRELENVIERAVALCKGSRIELDDLPAHIRDYCAAPSVHLMKLPSGGLDLEAHVAEIEMSLIKQALEVSRYSQKRAAELLGLSSRSLRYRLQKYGLESQ